MKSRQDIEKQTPNVLVEYLLLEVLLDIRELLQDSHEGRSGARQWQSDAERR